VPTDEARVRALATAHFPRTGASAGATAPAASGPQAGTPSGPAGQPVGA